MVLTKELTSRIMDFFRFRRQEISGLLVAVIVTGFIFSFRDWGDQTFNFIVGLQNFSLVMIIAVVSFFFRLSLQKIAALSWGYTAEFKVWWTGLVIALVVAFVSRGWVPLVLIGMMVSSFMVKQRLGEFRYGFSHSSNALVALWGVIASLIAATLFAVGLHILPQSYFFGQGLLMNLIMALCALLPLPQLEGLQIYFGSRGQYFSGVVATLLAATLLLTKTTAGLLITIILGSLIGIVFLLKRSGQ